MTAASRSQVLARLNGLPPNLTAKALLPPHWVDPSNLNVLTLAAWGLEQGLTVETPDRDPPQEAIAEQVFHLQQADPDVVMALLDGPEVQALPADALNGLTPTQGATTVLEAIRDLLAAS